MHTPLPPFTIRQYPKFQTKPSKDALPTERNDSQPKPATLNVIMAIKYVTTTAATYPPLMSQPLRRYIE
jgi:hypothetical protein